MEKEKGRSKGMGGVLLFLIFTAGIGKSEVEIPNIGIGGGIFHGIEGVIRPQLGVKFAFSDILGLEAKSFIFGQDMLSSQGRIMILYLLGMRKSFIIWYIGMGVQSFFTKELRKDSVVSIVELCKAWNMGVEFILGNFSFSSEISFSKEYRLSLNGHYYFIPKIKKRNPQEKKITYITMSGGALCGLVKPLLLGAIMSSHCGKSFFSYAYYYRYSPLIEGAISLIEGSICGYFTGKLISSWIKKDEGLVSSVAKGACSGLLGGTASFITGMASYHISGWGKFSYSEPCLAFLVDVTNISLWTISGAIYGAIAR
jgi:hypothetical protein